MKFFSPLQQGTLIKRYKRFFADVTLTNGEVVTAHCPNTGSMKTCGDPGSTVYLSHNPAPERKLKYTWELTQTFGGYIGVNTSLPNKIVEEAILGNLIPELSTYGVCRREVKYGENSRIDLLLENAKSQKCYVEIKNTTLLHEGDAAFPDAVTARGLKHLVELTKVVKCGHRAIMFYLVNRPDGQTFRIADTIDPAYAEGLRKAKNAGVEILAYRSIAGLTGIQLGCRVI